MAKPTTTPSSIHLANLIRGLSLLYESSEIKSWKNEDMLIAMTNDEMGGVSFTITKKHMELLIASTKKIYNKTH